LVEAGILFDPPGAFPARPLALVLPQDLMGVVKATDSTLDIFPMQILEQLSPILVGIGGLAVNDLLVVYQWGGIEFRLGFGQKLDELQGVHLFLLLGTHLNEIGLSLDLRLLVGHHSQDVLVHIALHHIEITAGIKDLGQIDEQDILTIRDRFLLVFLAL